MIDHHFKDRDVCILGLGYVGLTLAAVMADVGFNVTGVEIRDSVLALLKKGRPHFYEPGLADMIQRGLQRKKIRFAKHIPSDGRASVYIITVGTPLRPDGSVRMDMVEAVGTEVSQHLKKGDLVILRSTVKIGTTRHTIQPLLKKSKVPFDLAFCPERTLEGQALKELRELPQIIGALSEAASVRCSQIFQFLTPTQVRVSGIETAETIKLIDNAQRDVQFSYANEVARICDAVGVSAMEVIQSGKLGYPRTNLPMPGPVGGPCLEKDSHILAQSLRDYGIEPEITVLSRRLNESQPDEVAAALAQTTFKISGFPKRPTIALLGLAFKGRPATDDLRGTMARPIYAALKRHFPGAQFRAFDAVVSPADIKTFGVKPAPSLEAAFRGANLAVIMNNHPIFSSMPMETLAKTMARPALIYDFWNSFKAPALHLPSHVGYMALGSHGQAVLPGPRH